jgi:hypothetical protein
MGAKALRTPASSVSRGSVVDGSLYQGSVSTVRIGAHWLATKAPWLHLFSPLTPLAKCKVPSVLPLALAREEEKKTQQNLEVIPSSGLAVIRHGPICDSRARPHQINVPGGFFSPSDPVSMTLGPSVRSEQSRGCARPCRKSPRGTSANRKASRLLHSSTDATMACAGYSKRKLHSSWCAAGAAAAVCALQGCSDKNERARSWRRLSSQLFLFPCPSLTVVLRPSLKIQACQFCDGPAAGGPA